MPPPGPTYLNLLRPWEVPLAASEVTRFSDDIPIELAATEQAAASRPVYLPSMQTMQAMHFTSERGFAPTASFGYVKNRGQVAGFNAHGLLAIQRIEAFTNRPWYVKAKELWMIYRMELVSLLKQKQPAVYVSRNIPRMEELQQAETRPLNEFEDLGLQRLIDGEDVVIRSTLNRIEMLGSLRASKECLQCHSVKSGALLGVFSYEFLRDPQLDPREHPQLKSEVALTRAD
jgi:hypothetical protein